MNGRIIFLGIFLIICLGVFTAFHAPVQTHQESHHEASNCPRSCDDPIWNIHLVPPPAPDPIQAIQ